MVLYLLVLCLLIVVIMSETNQSFVDPLNGSYEKENFCLHLNQGLSIIIKLVSRVVVFIDCHQVHVSNLESLRVGACVRLFS